MFVALQNYSKEAVLQNANDRIPVMRPLFLHYPNDMETWSLNYEYFYGDDLLVAPVLEPEVDTWRVYLPGSEDNWIHLWDETETSINGQQFITVSAPLGKTPVFYRADSKWIDLFRSIRSKFSIV